MSKRKLLRPLVTGVTLVSLILVAAACRTLYSKPYDRRTRRRSTDRRVHWSKHCRPNSW